MSQKTPWAIAGVSSIIAVVAIAVMAVMAIDDDDHMNRGDNGYVGMMRGMGSMDSDQMLAGMRSILDDDEYELMLQHMTSHRGGGPMSYPGGIDGMMHRMMDGMWQQMPADSNNMMPGGR